MLKRRVRGAQFLAKSSSEIYFLCISYPKFQKIIQETRPVERKTLKPIIKFQRLVHSVFLQFHENHLGWEFFDKRGLKCLYCFFKCPLSKAFRYRTWVLFNHNLNFYHPRKGEWVRSSQLFWLTNSS